MTRLTPDMIKDVPGSPAERDAALARTLGMTMKGLAYASVGLSSQDLIVEELTAAAVPVTSGIGVTEGFSESVCAIVDHLGMDCFVTGRTDVAGLYEALTAGADIVFMADDNEFVAMNTRARQCIDNTRSTALGYFTALKVAAGGLQGKHVLLIGAGRVGSCAAELLSRENAFVTVVDVDRTRADSLRSRYRNFQVSSDLQAAVMESELILNASPARIPGEWIMEGARVSSPGVPYSFDEEGVRKMAALVHDPLQIGVSVMAVWSASLSLPRTPLAEGKLVWQEAI